MSKIGLKGASGLGDTIYAYPIVNYYAKKHKTVYYMTDYPEIYQSIPNVKCHPHQKLNYFTLKDGSKQPVDIRFTYTPRKYTPGTSQFTDSCISAGITKKIDLTIPWKIQNNPLVEKVKRLNKHKKKVCVLSAPYEPFGREDEWGKILRIDPVFMQNIVDAYKDEVFFIQVGNKYTLKKIRGVDIDLVNKTTVSDLFDLVKICCFGLSQIGNLLPLCECLGKRNMIIFTRKAIESENRFIAAITPEKTVHYKKQNISVFDNDIEKGIIRFNGFINS